MMSILNEALYFHDKPDLDTLIDRLQKHTLISKNIINPVIVLNNQDNIQSTPEVIKPVNYNIIELVGIEDKNEDFISPKQIDSLFWCLYIANFGYNDYVTINRNYGIKELEIKKNVIDYLKNNPNKMKETNYKITKIIIQEVMSDLMTSQKETSIHCLLAIISMFNMNIIMIDSNRQFLLEFNSNNDNQKNISTYLIKKDKHGKYHINTEPITNEDIDKLKNEIICLENYMKPMKSISGYKIEELEELSQKVGINILDKNEKRYKKQELYYLIAEIVKWA